MYPYLLAVCFPPCVSPQISAPEDRGFNRIQSSVQVRIIQVGLFGRQFLVTPSAPFQFPASPARHNGWICVGESSLYNSEICHDGPKYAHEPCGFLDLSSTDSVRFFVKPRATFSCPQVVSATLVSVNFVHKRALYHWSVSRGPRCAHGVCGCLQSPTNQRHASRPCEVNLKQKQRNPVFSKYYTVSVAVLLHQVVLHSVTHKLAPPQSVNNHACTK